ncbi:MAG TPA: ABC transporter permease [Gemmatimonadales bacterium]|jgi:predicted permease
MTNLRYAWRSLAKSPGFVAVAVLALGVGLGLSTTMFAVLDAVTHPYVAFHNPDRIFEINWWFGKRNPMSPPELYRYFRDHTKSFEQIAPVQWGDFSPLERDGREPIDVGVMLATPGWFSLTGIVPERGRAFTAADGPDVIVLSHDLWRSLFGLRRSVAGATLTMGNRVVSVVGVLPRGSGGQSVWMPLPASVESTSVRGYVRPWVRLRDGVTREQAAAELRALATDLTNRFDARQAPFAFELVPEVQQREEVRDIHKAMAGAALAVLLIACVNLAHLMMTRGLAKRRELALRMALGASRAAVIRQMFAECVVITVGGCATGGLVVTWCSYLLRNRVSSDEISWVGVIEPQLSWRVFALAAGAAALSAVLFGLLPAIRVAWALNLDDPLKDDAGTTTGRVRYRYNPLVITEVALALVLLMGGALLLRTVATLTHESSDTNDATLWRVMISSSRSDTLPGRPARETLLSTLRATPGVLDAAMVSGMDLRKAGGAISAEQTEDSTRTITMAGVSVVSPSFLKVEGLPILQGRDFEPGDAAGPGVAIVDALTAQRLYPGQSPVGHMVKLGSPASNGAWVPIIGVARSPRSRDGVGRYVPQPDIWIVNQSSGVGGLVFRSASPDASIIGRVTRQLRQLPRTNVMVFPFDYFHRTEMASRTFLARVFVTMGVVALGLAALGLYGVLAYAVTRRMREFAVRVALGAEPQGLLRMVLRDGFVMILGGIGVGAFAALAASRYLDSVLISVLPSDVVSLVISEVVLISAGLAAAFAPARRASKANPIDILRAS